MPHTRIHSLRRPYTHFDAQNYTCTDTDIFIHERIHIHLHTYALAHKHTRRFIALEWFQYPIKFLFFSSLLFNKILKTIILKKIIFSKISKNIFNKVFKSIFSKIFKNIFSKIPSIFIQYSSVFNFNFSVKFWKVIFSNKMLNIYKEIHLTCFVSTVILRLVTVLVLWK